MGDQPTFYHISAGYRLPNGVVHRCLDRRTSARPRIACAPFTTELPFGVVLPLFAVRNLLDGRRPPDLCSKCPGIREAVYDA
jgi:hypothetical protein